MQPVEFLTLTPPEAWLVVAALNGHLRTPGISAYDELRLAITDSCGPTAEGERLDLLYGVADWERLVVRVAQLSEPQAEAVLSAARSFWDAPGDAVAEHLYEVGLL